MWHEVCEIYQFFFILEARWHLFPWLFFVEPWGFGCIVRKVQPKHYEVGCLCLWRQVCHRKGWWGLLGPLGELESWWQEGQVGGPSEPRDLGTYQLQFTIEVRLISVCVHLFLHIFIYSVIISSSSPDIIHTLPTQIFVCCDGTISSLSVCCNVLHQFPIVIFSFSFQAFFSHPIS